MADKEVGSLTSAGTLDGTELIHVVKSGNSRQTTAQDIADLGGGGAVDSVNGNTGAVVLDPDDLDDSATTNKFTTASDISKLAGIETGADVTDATNVAAAGAAMLGTENQALTGGATVTSKSLGTKSSGTLTLDMGDRPLQHYTNGGAHTLAPGTVNGSCLVDITNNASAGAITTSGWTQVAGDDFDTTNGNKFRCHCSVGNAGSLLIVQAMQ